MSEIKLKPCPFCGSTDIKLWKGLGEVSGTCRKCGAHSGYAIGKTKEDAAEAWNRRADTEKSRAD